MSHPVGAIGWFLRPLHGLIMERSASMKRETVCIGDYIRIREGKRPDPETERRRLQKGFGIEHPERINGYAGLFFGRGDVFVSETVWDFMKDGDLEKFVLDALRKFERENYGDISNGDIEQNGENRWLSNGDLVMGRYGYYYGDEYMGKNRFDEVIRIRTWKGNIWITYDSEPDLFLLLDMNREEQASGETADETAGQAEMLGGIGFLKEYRAHPDRYLPLPHGTYQQLRNGEEIHLGPFHILCVGPRVVQREGEINEDSLNLLITYGKIRMLFTGDYMYDEVCESYGSLVKNVDIFIFPHHGLTPYAVTSGALQILHPGIILLPGDAEGMLRSFCLSHRWHFPIYGNRHGNIMIESDGAEIQVHEQVQPGEFAVNVSF